MPVSFWDPKTKNAAASGAPRFFGCPAVQLVQLAVGSLSLPKDRGLAPGWLKNGFTPWSWRWLILCSKATPDQKEGTIGLGCCVENPVLVSKTGHRRQEWHKSWKGLRVCGLLHGSDVSRSEATKVLADCQLESTPPPTLTMCVRQAPLARSAPVWAGLLQPCPATVSWTMRQIQLNQRDKYKMLK